MSRPVSYMVLITASSATRCEPSPRRASDAALIALTAPIALRSMQGICEPTHGIAAHAEVMLIPISAAFSICALLPPSAAARPAAAIESHADLALTANLRARRRRVALAQSTDRRRRQRERDDAFLVRFR